MSNKPIQYFEAFNSVICIHDQVRPAWESSRLGSLFCYDSIFLRYSVIKLLNTKRMTSRHLVFLCRIKPLKKGKHIVAPKVSALKVASGKPKRKHCSKRISQEQVEKEHTKKSRPFKQMPYRRAPVFLLSPRINTRGTTLPPC